MEGLLLIKMIAIDLDGTLLDDDKNYDEPRFNKLTEKINAEGGHVVIATGNQHVKSVGFFEELKSEIIFITDNGSTIHIDNELHYSKTLGNEEYRTFIKKFPEYLIDNMIISTHGYAMISNGEHDESFMNAANMHYPVLKRQDDLSTIEEPIVKVTLKFDEDYDFDVDEVEDILPDTWRMTSSGFGFYDIILSDISKLTAIKQLQEIYDLADDEIAVFGDSNNDFEMMEAIPNSYAMENGTDKVKDVSTHIIGNNNDQAVIDTLEELFN